MSAGQVQVKFFTKAEQYSVPAFPYNVPSVVGIEDLNTLINKLLADSHSSSQWSNKEFDFLIANEYLRLPLEQHLDQKNISSEAVVEIEYFEKHPSPTPADSFNHDDWISSVHSNDSWILTGCYDKTVNIWSSSGELKLVIPGHDAPVKTVQWINSNSPNFSFITGSLDQNALIWDWNCETNSVDCIYICRGHERSVDCLDLNENRSKFASGSWDKTLKIWSTLPDDDDDEISGNEIRKKLKSDGNEKTYKTRTPIVTLAGHNEAVSAVQWIDSNEICTASWDHTIKIWNIEMGAIKDQLVSNKSFFALSYSPLSRLLVSGSSDAHIRLWDPRGKGGSLVKCIYSSHTGWVTCLKWSTTNKYHFISGSQDRLLKQWDTRSPKTPLFDMSGHTGKVICCDWSNPQYMISGGDDNQLKLYNCKL